MDDAAPIAAGRRRSPLHDLRERFGQASQDTGDAIRLREIPFLAQVTLRGDVGNPAFCKAIRDDLKFDIPTKPNTFIASPALAALWMGPDEWLLIGDAGMEENLIPRLIKALDGVHSSVVDVSDARAVVHLSGARSRELLAKGCSLDLHPRAFRSGGCAQTNIARANVILQCLHGEPGWLLYVRTSFANYLASWLLDAMAEFCEDNCGVSAKY
jgi:sarcosine oxidase, subunit gamma